MYYQVFKKGQRNLVIFYSNWKWKYDMINLNPLSWIHTRVPYKWSNKYNFVQFKTYFYAHVQYICVSIVSTLYLNEFLLTLTARTVRMLDTVLGRESMDIVSSG